MSTLALVPLLSLAVVWACATAITVSDARQALGASSVASSLAPEAEDFLAAVQQERRQTVIHRADPRRAESLSRLEDTREATDAAASRLLSRAASARGGLDGSAATAVDALSTALGSLGQLRDQVERGTISRTRVLGAYNRLADPALRLLAALPPSTDSETGLHARAVAGLHLAREYLAREDALVAGALAAGRTTDTERDALAALMTERQAAYDTFLSGLPLEDRLAHESFWEDGGGRVLSSTEQSLAETGSVQPGQWDEVSGAALSELAGLAAEAGDRCEDAAASARGGLVRRAVLVGAGGFLAVALSAAVAWRVSRAQLREMRTLVREAREASEVRLPGVLRRLAAGDRVDVETEAPRLEYGADEAGQVGKAVNTLQRAALSAAVERAAVRRRVSEVFVNLARRSQVLLHRQLNILETAGQRAGTGVDRDELVRLTHLTARMRRHAEGLVVLSGAAGSRQWAKSELLMDVVRGAVDEVEDYDRIEIRRLPALAVAGAAVADLRHLLAELLENATVFSPPHTAVQVYGERVPHGFTLEIHDRGLGMTAEALQEANERLAQPPDPEAADTDRLGLLVVARLAERHGVRVSLRESPYGGTTAVTLIPGDLLTETGGQDALPHGQRPALLEGPADGPVELEAPVAPADTGPRAAPGSGWPPAGDGQQADGTPDPPGDGRQPGAPVRRTPVLVADHGRPVAPPPGVPPDQERPAAATTRSGLPRRVRGAAPGPRAPRPAADASPDTPDGRPENPVADLDAEAVRARMSSLQRGWRRGRQQTENRRGPTPPGTQP